jgi:hypothetical protein
MVTSRIFKQPSNNPSGGDSQSRRRRTTVADITRIYAFDKSDSNMMRRAVQIKALPENWRAYFRDRLGKVTKEA